MWDLRAEKTSRERSTETFSESLTWHLLPDNWLLECALGSTRQLSQKRDQHGNPINFKSKCSTRSCFPWNFFHHKRWCFRFLSTPFYMNFPMMSVYPRFNIQNTTPRISHFWGAVLASVPGHCLCVFQERLHMRLRHVTNHPPPSITLHINSFLSTSWRSWQMSSSVPLESPHPHPLHGGAGDCQFSDFQHLLHLSQVAPWTWRSFLCQKPCAAKCHPQREWTKRGWALTSV